jgi:ABC-type transport system substrate-binding protein
LVERARRTLDQVERLKSYQLADKILIEDAIILPLVYGMTHFLMKPWVKKYPLSPKNDLFWKDVVIEPHQGQGEMGFLDKLKGSQDKGK